MLLKRYVDLKNNKIILNKKKYKMNNKKPNQLIKLHKMMYFLREQMMILRNIKEKNYKELINQM